MKCPICNQYEFKDLVQLSINELTVNEASEFIQLLKKNTP